jgi:hypothetical protein
LIRPGGDSWVTPLVCSAVAEHGEAGDASDERRCLNCEAPLRGEYCSACGQRDLPSRLAIGELIREVLSETFELDGRVWRTLVPFLFRPGFLTREYIEGRRVRYTSPFRLFLAATLLWLAASFVAKQRVDFEAEVGDEDRIQVGTQVDSGPVTRWINERGRGFEELPEAEQAQRFTDAARETLPKAALLTIPIFALLMKLLFIRRGRYYVEHLVFALHVHAFGFVMLGLAALLGDDLFVTLALLLVGIYVYLALWRTYDARWWTSLLRLVALGLVHGVVLLLVTAFMLLATVLLG